MPESMPFRADHVGSLLRPPSLLHARIRHSAGEISDEQLRAAEDEAIASAVKQQEETGIDVVTDGEFRRRDFRTGFTQAVDGFTMRTWPMPWRSGDGVTRVPSNTWIAAARLRQRERLAAGEASFVRGLTPAPAKVTLIAPGFLVDRFWKDGVTDQFYSSREEFAADVAGITRHEIEALLAEGVRYVQLDNPGYGAFLGEHARGPAEFGRMLAADVAAVPGASRPAGTVIGFHVCRGNQSSMWMGSGDYEPIAERLFAELPVDRFLLEFDDERAGGFEPLRFVPPGTDVVLGLVSSKTGDLESPGALRRRIDAATAYVPGDRLAISPQCGFASIAEGGNLLSIAEQFAKLRLVADVARAAWGG